MREMQLQVNNNNETERNYRQPNPARGKNTHTHTPKNTKHYPHITFVFEDDMTAGGCGVWVGKWTAKAENKVVEFLAVGRACKDIFWPTADFKERTPDFKERTSDFAGFSADDTRWFLSLWYVLHQEWQIQWHHYFHFLFHQQQEDRGTNYTFKILWYHYQVQTEVTKPKVKHR